MKLASLIKKKRAANAYDMLTESQFILSIAKAFSELLKAQKKKNSLTTAYTDANLYPFTEALADVGFVWKDPLHTFFGGNLDDPFHPFNFLEDLEKFEFDAILGSSHLDLLFFAKKVKQALQELQLCNFKTCLNIHKIFTIAALVCLIPNDSTILEVGAYQCGTTIFMAQLCKVLNKRVHIFACDTFEGMPAATTPDKKDPIFYDSGMFTDNLIERVQKRIKNQNLDKSIHLIKGDAVSTLPNLTLKNISLVFLDTDQYKGTKAGLDLVMRMESRPHIIIDDTGLSSIDLAIREFLDKNPAYSRKNVLTNFDYLFATV